MAIPPPLASKKSQKWISKKKADLLFKLLLAIVLSFVINQISFIPGERFFYDLLVRTKIKDNPSSEIILVYIDKKTIETLKKIPTFKEHNQFLKTLHNLQPQIVAYDIDLSKIDGTIKDKTDFANTANTLNDFLQILKSVTLKEDKSKIKLGHPFEKIKSFSGLVTEDSSSFISGGTITRRMILTYEKLPLFHYYTAQKFNSEIFNIDKIQGIFNYLDTDQVFIDYNKSGTYPSYNFLDFIEKSPLNSLKNKIILVGTNLNSETDEYISTPMNYSVKGMTRLEMHANMIDTLIKNNAPYEYPKWLRYLTVFILSILVIYIVLTLPPVRGLIFVGSLFVFITLTGWIVFNVFHLWLPLWHSYLTLFLCYYFFIPYRLILENRRSWEYYEKNKLLKQVEELKTNFISMMSHDLKTPIARIQGMSDVILQDPVILSHQQREAVDTIKQSGDDLLKFINSILEYAKIESEGIKLNYESRDLNTLIEDVLKKFEFHAKIKKIKISKNLEPLFPIPMDPNLMKQVISNLIENAIKYSPEESTIHITTSEENSKVLFKVKDEGSGISKEDLPHVFDKFFRSRNAKISSVKGSGLGLYLAKYFTTMHGGDLLVESSLGVGTTFTVILPV